MGYPNIFPTTQAQAINCGWLTRSERAAVVQLASDMDATLRSAAHNAGAAFVSTLTALAGHEECTDDSWMVPISVSGRPG